MLKPNKFYSHECIHNLIEFDGDLDIQKSENMLQKVSSGGTSSPYDDYKATKNYNKFCSPIEHHLSDRKGIFKSINLI